MTRWNSLKLLDKAVIAISLLLACFLLLDPLVLQISRNLYPETHNFFAMITELGKSELILVPSGIAAAAAFWLKNRASNRRMIITWAAWLNMFAFVFIAVAGSGVITQLVKHVVGRARPKLFDELGSFYFSPFAFVHDTVSSYDFASFPSGHATTALAFGTAIACIFPRIRVIALTIAAWIAASRFLIGSHYISDAVAGAAWGAFFTLWLQKTFAKNRLLFRQNTEGYELRGRRLYISSKAWRLW
jgi:undecaprenyl-diphosphatase